ncbi:MAG: M20/M25/M40 family metallo-hydrolase [Nitrososphaeraceae archaeon]
MENLIEKYIDAQIKNTVLDLQALIRIPSVSAKNHNLLECATAIHKLMINAGINSEILYLENEKIPPIVFGDIQSKKNPNGKTLLFYNHYDVQPEDPIDEWDFPPFSGEISGNYIYGRGASDDKGELITRIKAVEAFLKETGDIPCNVKFIVEGEEEIGSSHIEQYLIKYREKFRCDGIIWEFGYINEKNKPIISLGMKGLLYIELIAFGPNKDTHSSLAVIIENPAWKLIKLLDSMVDKNGRILINDWYSDVRDFLPEEESLLSSEIFNEESFKTEYGIANFLGNIKGIEIKKALCGYPTCNISGIVSGYTGQGAKTIIPSYAKVKIDFRLVPDMIPKKQFELLKKHVEKQSLKNIDIKFIHGEPAARVSYNDPFVNLVNESTKEIFGETILNISSAGTGPMHSFQKILNVPSISLGCTYIYSKIHSPNEYARIDLLASITKCLCKIIERLAK